MGHEFLCNLRHIITLRRLFCTWEDSELAASTDETKSDYKLSSLRGLLKISFDFGIRPSEMTLLACIPTYDRYRQYLMECI